MTSSEILPGDRVTYRGEEWTLTGHDGYNIIHLENAGGARLTITVDELLREDNSPARRNAIVDPMTNASRVPYYPHVLEILDGTPLSGMPPRPDLYGPGLPRMPQYERKAAEMKLLGLKISARTLERHVENYQRARDISTLVDGRTCKEPRDPWRNVDPRIRPLCKLVLTEQSSKSSRGDTAQAFDVRLKFMLQYPDDEECLPSPKEIVRLLKDIEQGVGGRGSAKTRSSEMAAPRRNYETRKTDFMGATVEMDTTPGDLLVKCSDGKARRPHVLVLLDGHTRVALGTHVTLNPRGEDVSEFLADVHTDPRERPVRYLPPSLRDNAAKLGSWAKILNPEFCAGIDANRPRIAIRRLTTDNGADYRADCVERTCHMLEISHHWAGTHDPTHKAHVERMMKTIGEGYLCHMPGYVGNSADARGEGVEAQDLLDIDTFAFLIDYLVMHVYNNREHGSLSDPRHRLSPVHASPNERYRMALKTSGGVLRTLNHNEYIWCLPRDSRTIQRHGIKFENRYYNSPELMDFYYGPDYRKKKYDIHYSSRDWTHIWLSVPGNPDYIACGLPEDPFESPGIDEWDHLPDVRRERTALNATQAGDAAARVSHEFKVWENERRAEEARLEDERKLRFAQAKYDRDAPKLDTLTAPLSGSSTAPPGRTSDGSGAGITPSTRDAVPAASVIADASDNLVWQD